MVCHQDILYVHTLVFVNRIDQIEITKIYTV